MKEYCVLYDMDKNIVRGGKEFERSGDEFNSDPVYIPMKSEKAEIKLVTMASKCSNMKVKEFMKYVIEANKG